ncbi:MAG TPA: fatty acid desaturase CarF family protein [Planctomycetota bacterium]|nr:fatty acid desaturase CarF family protein [Planctomycetota bacterium]
MTLPLTVFLIVLRIAWRVALCFLIADLIVGLVHWLEDSYGSPTWPIVGAAIIAPNLLHHAQPRAFLTKTWWQGSDVQAIVGGAILGIAAVCGWFSLELLLVVVLAVNANEFHRWAHRTRAENGRLISFLQDWKLLQSRAHHGRHHGGRRDSHYCAITAWVDPLLERIRLWRMLEAFIVAVSGVRRRVDPAVAARAQRG